MGKCGDTAIRLEAQQGVEPENLILLCVEHSGARVMHLSETRGPDERHASLQNSSVLGEEIFCVTECKAYPVLYTNVSGTGLVGKTVHNSRFRFIMLLTCSMQETIYSGCHQDRAVSPVVLEA